MPRAQGRPEKLFEALLARILSGELAAGARLPPERELAVAYRTNRNTLREAVRRLEQARLVSSRQGQGVTVLDFRRTASIDLLGPFLEHGQDLRERAQVMLDLLAPRLHFAELLAATAAAHATREDVERLEKTVRAARKAMRRRSAKALVAAQDEWLEGLVEATHSLPVRWVANPFLAALRDLLGRQPELMPFKPSFAAYAASTLGAIAGHDRAAAVEATRTFHREVDRHLAQALLPVLRGTFEEE